MVSLDRIKVYFCGQPETGKTTLSRALIRAMDPNPADASVLQTRTRGIDIVTARLPNGVMYSLWDFAGQADYHVHHDLFMFPNAAVFMVLIDLRKTSQERHAHATYWLQYIVTQCPPGSKPNVLMLATHVDEVNASLLHGETEDLFRSLARVFDDDVVFVSCEFVGINCLDTSSQSLRRVEELLESARLRFLAENPSPTPLICKQMIDVLDGVRRDGLHYMSWSMFCETMKSVTDDAELLTIATRHLHQIGDVYYNESARLKDLVIIDLGWLCHEVLGWLFCPTDMLAVHEQVAMMRFRQLAETGAVKQDDIPITQMFTDAAIDVLGILELFELCFGFDQGESKVYVFPTLLRTEAPKMSWVKTAAYDMHIGLKLVCASDTTMIPPGFFQRIQVRAMTEFKRGTAAQSLAWLAASIWQNGVICQHQGVSVLLSQSEDLRSISIHARGGNGVRRDVRLLLLRIVKIIIDIANRSPGLQLDVHHCSRQDLGEYSADPATFSQAAVIKARVSGAQEVLSPDRDYREDVVFLLGLDSKGELKCAIAL